MANYNESGSWCEGEAAARVIGWKRGTVFVAFVLAVLALCLAAAAKTKAQPIARQVLALYDSAIESTPSETKIHRFAEMPLNHLGYVLVYSDIRKPLPTPDQARQYAGVLTWFPLIPKKARAYLEWASGAAEAGVKFVILGEIGGAFWSDDLPEINTLLAGIGLEHSGRFVDITFDTQVTRRPAVFEAALDPVLPPYPVLKTIRGDVSALLDVAAPLREGVGKSVLVAVGPGGGYAAPGFEMIYEPRLNRARWLIDPFLFFSRAFGGDDWPRPDITTLSGRRAFFSHIDGEGVTAIDSEEGSAEPVAHLLLEKVIKAYPDIPVSLALKPNELDPAQRTASFRDVLREIWTSTHVEPVLLSDACRDRTRFFQDRGRPKEECDGERLSVADIGASLGTLRNLVSDTTLSIRLLQWTDKGPPSDVTVAAAYTHGLLSVAGRESRIDTDFPSIAYVAPMARPTGAGHEAYLSGDDLSRTEGISPVGILRRMPITAERTDLPRRLTASSFRYRASWLSERDATKAIERRLAEVQKAPLMPIRTTDYAAMVNDFAKVHVSLVSENAWQLDNLGTVRTVRFDKPSEWYVDLVRSQGVLGEVRHGGSLYVALADTPSALVVLGNGAGQEAVGLRDSRWLVSRLVRKTCGWTFAASGFGPGEFTWYGVPQTDLAIVAKREGERQWYATLRPDRAGSLSFVAPADGLRPLMFDVQCRSDAGERAP